jgi:hypothetical protein
MATIDLTRFSPEHFEAAKPRWKDRSLGKLTAELLHRFSHRRVVASRDLLRLVSTLEFIHYPVAQIGNVDRGGLTLKIIAIEVRRIVKGFPIFRKRPDAFRGHYPVGIGKGILRAKSGDLVVSVSRTVLRFFLGGEIIALPFTGWTAFNLPPILTVWLREFEDLERGR